MEFREIQLTKQNTLTVVFKNADGDIVTQAGANIVHKDLKMALRGLVPHLCLLAECRESVGNTLKDLEVQDGTDEKSCYHRLSVLKVTLNECEREVCVSGTRILDRGDVVNIASPKINIEEDEHYQYLDELSLAIDNVKYEVKLYIEEKKWGLKEGSLNFSDTGDPFKGVKPGDVPDATQKIALDGKKKKKGAKKKDAA